MGFKLAGHLGAHTYICKGYIKVAAVGLKVQSMIGLGMVTDKSSSHAMCYSLYQRKHVPDQSNI